MAQTGKPSKKEQPETEHKNDDKKGKAKLVIYDFDQTITCLHLYRELHGGQMDALSKLSDDELITIFGGQERIKSLDKHFKYLTDSHIEISILSFGWSEVIINALKRVSLDIYFANKLIIGRDSYEMKIYNKNKSKYIKKMMEQKNLTHDQVLFVDDALSNIQQAKSICDTLHIMSRNGMNDQEMSKIEGSVYKYLENELRFKLCDSKDNDKTDAKSQKKGKNGIHKKRGSSLDKYKITNVPKWFDDLNKKDDQTPVIEIKEDSFPEINGTNENHQNNGQEIKIATKFTFGNDNGS